MKIALAAFALVLVIPASAQLSDDKAHELVASGRTAAASIQAREKALQEALFAMGDGVEAGGAVLAFIKENDIQIRFTDDGLGAWTEKKAGKTVILISDKAPMMPRVIAPLIAKAAVAGMFTNMMDCAERSYMRRATVARVWIELGGEPAKLPVLEPIGNLTEYSLVEMIMPWTKDVQTALSEISRIEKVPTIPDLEPTAHSELASAALARANQRFTKFLSEEREVRQAAGLR